MIDPRIVNQAHDLFNAHRHQPDQTRQAVEKLIDTHGAYPACMAIAECAMMAYARLPSLKSTQSAID